MNNQIYDIETYPNIFTCAFIDSVTLERRIFEISERKNDFVSFCDFVWRCNCECSFVGFNNFNFDYPIIHMIVNDRVDDYRIIFQKCQLIINSFDSFDHLIWDNNHIVTQIDLFKIHHFDNAARRTSLKSLEFNMLMSNIKDLPFPVAQPIPVDKFDDLISYNFHDVEATLLFYNKSKDQLAIRRDLSRTMGIDTTNFNDTKIGKQFIINELGRDICYFKNINGKSEPRQTIRNNIALNDIILNSVTFSRPEFNAILNYLKQTVIFETKAAFTDKPISPDVLEFADQNECFVLRNDKKIKLNKLDGRYTGEIVYSKGLNTIINGFKFIFGTGGLHACVDPCIVESDQDYMIIDIDVASYYPNIAIKNKFFPAHLGEHFYNIYSSIYDKRKKTDKKSPENALFKLALNGVFGDSNSQFSPFYDPAFTMSITLNGQLLLCILSELLMVSPDLKMIQVNTDGITIKVPRTYEKWVNKTCDYWEQLTGLELERVEYSKFFVRDVNNYIAVYNDGNVKRKGAYAHDRNDPRELPYHKNHSQLVVPKAAENSLLNNKKPDEFIKCHGDIFDFMIRAKVPRSSELQFVKNGKIYKLENITRYYVTDNDHGGRLFKMMPPIKGGSDWRKFAVCKGFNVSPVNDLTMIKDPINFDYYIGQTNKLIDPIKNGS